MGFGNVWEMGIMNYYDNVEWIVVLASENALCEPDAALTVNFVSTLTVSLFSLGTRVRISEACEYEYLCVGYVFLPLELIEFSEIQKNLFFSCNSFALIWH